MSQRLPPRREPRVLALSRSPAGFTFAVADPWELRSAGEVSCQEVSLSPAVLRVARREKPTLIVADPALLKPASRVALRLHVAILGNGVTQDLPRLPLKIACDLYPELPLRAPTLGLAQVAGLAIAAVLYADAPCPSRHYAPRRKPHDLSATRRYRTNECAA